jgi:hypothetical protein
MQNKGFPLRKNMVRLLAGTADLSEPSRNIQERKNRVTHMKYRISEDFHATANNFSQTTSHFSTHHHLALLIQLVTFCYMIKSSLY